MVRKKVFDILYYEALETYKSSREEYAVLDEVEKLRKEFVRKYGNVMKELFEKIEEHYMNYSDINMKIFFVLGFKNGFMLAEEIKREP